jgi:hypothetical protein
MRLAKPVVQDEFEDDVDDSVDDGPEDDGYANDGFDEDLGYDDGYGGFGGPSPMEKHSDLLKGLTDFEPFMRTMVAEWLGMVWSEKEEDWIEDKSVKPTMNLYGARWCVNQLRTYTRDNNVITCLDKDTYQFIMCDVIDTVWLNVGTRSAEFGIHADGDILKVCNQLEHASALVLIGTGGTNNYKDLLQKSVNVSESHHYQDNTGGNRYPGPSPQQKVGFFQAVTNLFNKLRGG